MGKIYTGIELGTSDIKIMVLEVIQEKYYVLSATTFPSKGIRKREIIDLKSCSIALQNALKKAEEEIGMKIEEAILSIPPEQAFFSMEQGQASIASKVGGYEIKAALKDAVFHKYDPSEELVDVLPISFHVDEGLNMIDPKGEEGKTLFSKVVMGTISKEVLTPFLQVFRSVGVHIKDIIFSPQADYETCENKELNRKMGAIINIGEEITSVSIFNKGILIKNENLSVGSSYVDKDLSYIYKISKQTSREIKETFAITSSRYADTNEEIETVTEEDKKITLNQAETSKIIESRIAEILKLAKVAINNLTKREINYIIVLGGISELAGFSYLVEDILGQKASVWNMQELGARHNKFTTVFGSCKYYHKKCTFQEEDGSMFSDVEGSLFTPKKKERVDGSINKFFGH